MNQAVHIICGALTAQGRQCQVRVSRVGDHCRFHRGSSSGQRVRRVLGLCWKVVEASAALGGAAQVYQQVWPHLEPLIRTGILFPEEFWWDGLRRARKLRGQRGVNRLRIQLEAVLEKEKRLIQKVDGLSRPEKSSAEAAFLEVSQAIYALETKGPRAGRATPNKSQLKSKGRRN